MPYNSWGQTLVTQHAVGTALTNSTTATSLLNGQAKFTLPANLVTIGTKFRIHLGGRISTVVTTPGTLTFDFKFGAVIVLTSGALALNTTAQTNANLDVWAELTAFTEGSGTAATMYGRGALTSRVGIGSAAVATSGVLTQPFPDTSPAVGTGFDSTVSNVVDVFGTWSVANASNSIRIDDYELILCN